jgi:hypothetical protein
MYVDDCKVGRLNNIIREGHEKAGGMPLHIKEEPTESNGFVLTAEPVHRFMSRALIIELALDFFNKESPKYRSRCKTVKIVDTEHNFRKVDLPKGISPEEGLANLEANMLKKSTASAHLY